MTKKDYQAIAREMCRCFQSPLDHNTLREVINALSKVMMLDNPRFDWQRFEEACLTGKCKGMKA